MTLIKTIGKHLLWIIVFINLSLDVISENMTVTKNISIVSTNSTKNSTVNRTADSRRLKNETFIITSLIILIIVYTICGPVSIELIRMGMRACFENIEYFFRNGYRNTIRRLRKYFRRDHPEPAVRHEINGGIELIADN
ncbi:uncharacterized protein LOC105432170 [Pogonomyrmex barbatus]|uniref:Uncharacterized protein LOC105432170 n=1 Tax=Pogonomyrmex barbatus TaxID=144034 RepID=A0A6I9WS59_9HYME|nr:uncharacterized protein LOC105432170 [Pogonomyrmex barbatus]